MGKLFLVDLAGSERLKKSKSTGLRASEAKSINLSLTTLVSAVPACQEAAVCCLPTTACTPVSAHGTPVPALAALTLVAPFCVQGMCINARADPNATHVPFRDSKLTRLLQARAQPWQTRWRLGQPRPCLAVPRKHALLALGICGADWSLAPSSPG